MLDFLNLKYEAELVVWFCILSGALAGMGFGLLSVNGKGWREKLWTVLAWLFIGLAVVAGGLACVAGFVLLITFKWGQLFKALLIGGALGGLLYLILKGVFANIRLSKYRRNPLMKEIVAYCRKNDVVGIQCFADRGYPNLPDVGMFAQVLAGALGGCAVASHRESTKKDYFQYNQSTGQRELVHLTTYTYQDHFVYKKSVLKKLQQRNKQQDKELQAQQAAAQKNANRWE